MGHELASSTVYIKVDAAKAFLLVHLTKAASVNTISYLDVHKVVMSQININRVDLSFIHSLEA